MDRTQKHAFVKDFSEVVKEQSLLVVTRQTGLSVLESEELRASARKNDAAFKIVKNTLLRLALKDTKADALTTYLEGPTGLSYSKDALAAAKAVVSFAKNNKKLEVLAGVLDGRLLSAKEVKELADLPSLDALRSKLVGLMVAPLQKVARTCAAPGSGLARIFTAYSQKS